MFDSGLPQFRFGLFQPGYGFIARHGVTSISLGGCGQDGVG
jgi:hypothetical protein